MWFDIQTSHDSASFDIVMNARFCSHKVLSDSLYLLSSGVHLSNRWNDHDYELAKCGHHIDSYCYLDSPKCVRCDIVSFINDLD